MLLVADSPGASTHASVPVQALEVSSLILAGGFFILELVSRTLEKRIGLIPGHTLHFGVTLSHSQTSVPWAVWAALGAVVV